MAEVRWGVDGRIGGLRGRRAGLGRRGGRRRWCVGSMAREGMRWGEIDGGVGGGIPRCDARFGGWNVG